MLHNPAFKDGFGLSNKIDEMNQYAEKRYRLKSLNIAVEGVPRWASYFYIDDFEHLGWKPYTLNCVNIHKIPG